MCKIEEVPNNSNLATGLNAEIQYIMYQRCVAVVSIQHRPSTGNYYRIRIRIRTLFAFARVGEKILEREKACVRIHAYINHAHAHMQHMLYSG